MAKRSAGLKAYRVNFETTASFDDASLAELKKFLFEVRGGLDTTLEHLSEKIAVYIKQKALSKIGRGINFPRENPRRLPFKRVAKAAQMGRRFANKPFVARQDQAALARKGLFIRRTSPRQYHYKISIGYQKNWGGKLETGGVSTIPEKTRKAWFYKDVVNTLHTEMEKRGIQETPKSGRAMIALRDNFPVFSQPHATSKQLKISRGVWKRYLKSRKLDADKIPKNNAPHPVLTPAVKDVRENINVLINSYQAGIRGMLITKHQSSQLSKIMSNTELFERYR